ncbi:hypothetical protein Tbis_2188 [Thermobispora bispora DSM 43833]|uniref:Uncharacterized protein n=1 Tax=Thermobispora bispora (strain ATCC 19993 / DSM 43833 / CBS 139.67 / JCM 10125 / KCTC 9307 / NBRC 14880 / R51) TaxID=469371 RepID=D6Y324_THEBD|nr:hypothetical protein Tbis_2188 [Thermobispora bispora DSM 43833]
MAIRQETMLCRTCFGSGRAAVPRAAVHNGRIGTALVDEQCKHCKGQGYIVYEVGTADEQTDDQGSTEQTDDGSGDEQP